jgi:O-antigen/teichoic acid export membrane protein
MSMGSLGVMVCNGGISPTVQRFASYYAAGARKIEATGSPLESGSSPNLDGMADLGHATSRLFFWLATGLLLLWSGIGTPVLINYLPSELAREGVLAWQIHGVGLWLLILAAGRTALVQGAGDMLASQRWLFVSRLAASVAGVSALLLGCGVVSVGIATITMGGIQYIGHAERFGYWTSTPIRLYGRRGHLQIIWPTTWRFSVVTGSAWMITSAGTTIVGGFFGLAAAGSYGVTVQVIQFASALGAVWMSSAVPRLCAIRAADDKVGLKRLFLQRWVLGIATYSIVATGIIFLGPLVLDLIGSKTTLLPLGMVATLALIYLLELNHGALCAAFIMTENRVPFLLSAVVSGFAIVSISLLFAALTSLGVWSVVVAQGLVQLVYNNWKWPALAFSSVMSRECSHERIEKWNV